MLSFLRSIWGAAPPSPRLGTARLLLREFLPEDERPLYEYRADPEVHRFHGHTTPTTPAQARTLLALYRSAAHRRGSFAVVRLADERLIGECCVLRLVPGDDAGFLGFLFGRASWGQGYATEAAGALMKHAFTALGVPRIIAGCHPDNPASRRVLQKLGMRAEPPRRGFPGAPPDVESLVFSAEAKAWLDARAH